MKTRLLTSTVIPLAVMAGVSVAVIAEAPGARANQQIAQNPCAAKRGCNPCNPCAAKRACNPCNPCAARRACNPCNPCAAKRACNPCNPCNPCAGGAASYSSACVVPRLVAANPCAAKRACNPCNPCAAKRACNPCNPCAAKRACNPCNPCAAKRACNPCAAKRACSPCNPCAAKRACNPCNPCAARRACNPCAAKRACNPCNPCAAKRACNPCNPCGAAAAVKLTAGEARTVYNCLKGELKTAYAKSGNLWAKWYLYWARFSSRPYPSSTHGGRFVSNYASKKAAGAYAKFEKAGKMTSGGILAKDSFSVTPHGRVSVGPLFLMEKMGPGFNRASGNWRYTLIMPNGQVVGTTNGKGSNNVKFCAECHAAVAQEQDHMFFLPTEYRASR